MCIKHVDYFEVCGHNGNDDAYVAAFSEIEKCPVWDGQSCKALRNRDVKHPGKCPTCAGNEEREVLWYKHCFQSGICDHEYGHALTDLERYRDEGDIVLVTPTYGLCPDCEAAGYDNRPGRTNLLNTASIMPKGFENLTRRPVDSVPRVSVMPSDDLTKAITSSRPDGSSMLTSTCNPAASRAPASKEPSSTSRPLQAPNHTSQAPTQVKVSSQSQYPASSQAPRNQSKYPGESRQPPKHPAPTASSVKLATQIYNPISKVPEGDASNKPVMSPADYLKRGAPKNVSPSAFYSNADGDEARAQLASPSAALPQAGYSTRPSSAPKANTLPSTSYARTQAPPADAEGPDLEELMSNATLAPSYHPSEGAVALPSRTPDGHTPYPPQAWTSQAPGISPVQRSEAPRLSQMLSQSRAPPASSLQRAEAPKHSLASSLTSQLPANSSQPLQSTPTSNASWASEQSSTSRPSPSSRPQPQTALPGYKSVASPQSTFPSKAPPQYAGSHSVAPNGNAPQSSVPRPAGRNGDKRHQISSVPEENEEEVHQ